MKMPSRIMLAVLLTAIIGPGILWAIDFDELDLPPTGAHEGQMLLGFYVTAGFAGGSVIDAENDFLDGSTYTFPNETTKLIEAAHLPLSFGLSFEYMPFDYFGVRTKLRRTYIIQRSTFGPDYENQRESLYTDYSLLFGITFHATTRRQWDFTLTPMAGYAFYRYNATPIGEKLITGYSGNMNRSGSGIIYGMELNCTIYFSGGLFLSFGYEWMRNPVSFSRFNLVNPQTNVSYNEGETSGIIDTHSLAITAGYAFSN